MLVKLRSPTECASPLGEQVKEAWVDEGLTRKVYNNKMLIILIYVL